jgi:hypothetical protein
VGTGAALSALGLGALTRTKWLLMLAPVLGYGPAWVGHFFVQGNTPATFKHPLWSLRADMRMFGKMIAGTMDAEVVRVEREAQAAERPSANGQNGESHPFAASVAQQDHDPSTLN